MADRLVQNILTSLLAVNSWTVDRIIPLTDRLKAAGLLDWEAISAMSIDDISVRLARAGYDRGDYMNRLLARRVASAASSLTSDELQRLRQCLEEDRRTDVSSTLLRVRGIGPVVLNTFWNLQDTVGSD
jgi:hypothetical protein